MSQFGKQISIREGARLSQELLTHYPESGGELAAMWAPPGTGKTSLLVTIAGRVAYFDNAKKRLMKETVVWKGREEDNWHLIQGKKICVHVFFGDDISFLDTSGNPIEVETLRYNTGYEIAQNLKRGWVNVVYEPRHYSMDEELLEEIMESQFLDTRPKRIPGAFFIYEVIYFIKKNKNPDEFVTVIIDEADHILRLNAKNPQRHFQDWFRDSIVRDLRKTKMSFLIAFHDSRTVDWTIIEKIMMRIYLKAALIPKDSELRMRRSSVKPGHYMIEKYGRFGIAKYDKIDTNNMVIAR